MTRTFQTTSERGLDYLLLPRSPRSMPFGLTIEDFSGFALTQFQKRYARIERSRGKTLQEVLHGDDETPTSPAS